jgi:hypothetical protein
VVRGMARIILEMKQANLTPAVSLWCYLCRLDHCVQLVGFSGYGKQGGYFIVRNRSVPSTTQTRSSTRYLSDPPSR